jgi:hypothetical protein
MHIIQQQMVKHCRGYFESQWFKFVMRFMVILMNSCAWYLINYELIEYWENDMDKYVVKCMISTLAVMMLASYVTAAFTPLGFIPDQTDPIKLKEEECWKCVGNSRENPWKPERARHCNVCH